MNRTERAAVASETDKRVAWLDYLTVVSMFAVVWVHVSARVVLNATDPFFWWVGNVADAAARWATPVFVMVSGYLLLDPEREYTISSFFRKRAARVLIPLIFWSLFYVGFSVMSKYTEGQEIGIRNFVGPIFIGRPYYHLWYLYMLTGLYFSAPFLRVIVARCTRRELALLCVALMSGAALAKTANFFYFGIMDGATNGSIFITWFLDYLGYFLAGRLLGQAKDARISLPAVLSVLAASIVLTSVGMFVLTEKTSIEQGQFFYAFVNPTVVAMTLSVFLGAKKVLARAPGFKTMEHVSRSMLGVYVLHPAFIALLDEIGVDPNNANPVVTIPLIAGFVFAISAAVADTMRRMPFIGRVV